jgi:hypothetical protein
MYYNFNQEIKTKYNSLFLNKINWGKMTFVIVNYSWIIIN